MKMKPVILFIALALLSAGRGGIHPHSGFGSMSAGFIGTASMKKLLIIALLLPLTGCYSFGRGVASRVLETLVMRLSGRCRMILLQN
jgi:hypothetical protein